MGDQDPSRAAFAIQDTKVVDHHTKLEQGPSGTVPKSLRLCIASLSRRSNVTLTDLRSSLHVEAHAISEALKLYAKADQSFTQGAVKAGIALPELKEETAQPRLSRAIYHHHNHTLFNKDHHKKGRGHFVRIFSHWVIKGNKSNDIGFAIHFEAHTWVQLPPIVSNHNDHTVEGNRYKIQEYLENNNLTDTAVNPFNIAVWLLR
jgi:hypothetical protein